MNDRQTSLLLIISIVLFIISLVLMSAWAYLHLQNKEKVVATQSGKELPAKEVVLLAAKDSLKKIYTGLINKLYTSLPSTEGLSDSSKKQIDTKVQELYKFRDEISPLLAGISSDNDLENARLKVVQLQLKINNLQSKTQEVELENKRLTIVLDQLKNDFKNREQTYGQSVPVNTNKSDKVSALSISDVRLWAADITGKETKSAQLAEKIQGSFVVRKAPEQSHVFDIFIVVVQPDGTVLKVSDWESGAFETNEGRKFYSAKLMFDYLKEESKRLSFTVNGDDLEKGSYACEIYQNGHKIGKASIILM